MIKWSMITWRKTEVIGKRKDEMDGVLIEQLKGFRVEMYQ